MQQTDNGRCTGENGLGLGQARPGGARAVHDDSPPAGQASRLLTDCPA